MSFGSECWYCYWGWAVPVVKVYREAVESLGGDNEALEYGPSHIVWSDENFDDGSIDFCLVECDDPRFYNEEEAWDERKIEVVRQSLLSLKDIPENVRCCVPKEYDGQHPNLYPPTIPVANPLTK